MGETTTRYFRDKLSMRLKAQESGLSIPEFVHILNHGKVQEFQVTIKVGFKIER